MSDIDYEKLINDLINEYMNSANLRYFNILILALYRIGKINIATRNALIQKLYVKTTHDADWFLDVLKHAKGIISTIPINYNTVVYKLVSTDNFNDQLAVSNSNEKLHLIARLLGVFLSDVGTSKIIWFTQFAIAQEFCDKVNLSNDFNIKFRVCPVIIDSGASVELNHSKYGYYKTLK